MGGLARCDGCGALSWSPLQAGSEGDAPTCEICGEPLKPERRRPGRRFGKAASERRGLAAPPKPADRPPAPLSGI